MDIVQADDVNFIQDADGSIILRPVRTSTLPALGFYAFVALAMASFVYILVAAIFPREDGLHIPALIAAIVVLISVAISVYLIFQTTQTPEIRFDAARRQIEFPTRGDHREAIPFSQISVIETAQGRLGFGTEARFVLRILTTDDEELHLATLSGVEAEILQDGKEVVKALRALTNAKATGPLAPFQPRPAPRKPAPATPAAPAAAASQPAQQPRTPSPLDNTAKIVDALRRLQTEGKPGSLVRFWAIRATRVHIEVRGEAGDRMLRARAPGNPDLHHKELDETKLRRLISLGWKAPRGQETFYTREWLAINDGERERIAGQIIRTLDEVYGWNPKGYMSIESHYDGGEDERFVLQT